MLVAGVFLGGCSGEAKTHSSSAGGDGGTAAGTTNGDAANGGTAHGGAANEGGHGGSVAAAGAVAAGGSATVAERNPTLIQAPDDTCERFHFTEATCTAQCPAWPCDPTVFNPFGDTWCNAGAKNHCASGFDCTAAEADATRGTLSSCLAMYTSCVADADCPGATPYCVIDARYTSGSCDTGLIGMRCREDNDCRAGSFCIANAADGTRGCSDGAEGSLCNVDAECQGKRCIHEPGISVNGLNPDPKPALVGVCSSGESGKRCFVEDGICPPNMTCSVGVNDGKCVGDARCIRVADGNVLCTSGNVGDPCSVPSDCNSNHCNPSDDPSKWSLCAQ
ncbi:MAG TPA: hypothetical protein VER96_31265 [Polyangiaceae bacterium]|nr:hypothetical protein [Polyangiaceae bacterium]